MEETVSEARYLGDLGKYDQATEILRQALAATHDGLQRLSLAIDLATVLRSQGLWKESFETLEHEIRSASEAAKEQPVFLQVEMDALLLRPFVLASFEGVTAQAAGVFRRLLEARSAGLVHELDPPWVQPLSPELPSIPRRILTVT